MTPSFVPQHRGPLAHWLRPGFGKGRVWVIVGLGVAWTGCESSPHAGHGAAASTTRADAPATSHTSHATDGGGSGGSGAAGGMGGSAGQAGDSAHAVPAPKLDGLLVDGVEIGLKPRFDPETTRYSLLASDPAGDLSIVALAHASLELEIAGRKAASSEPMVLTDVTPGSEFEIEITNEDGASRTYTVLYLPADFPNFHVAARQDSASPDPLYLGPLSRSAFYIVKLNNDGVPLFYRKTERPAFDFKKHPTGEMSYVEWESYPTPGEHVVLDETFREKDRVTSVGLVDTDEHEFLIRPNGNYIVLAYERSVRDLTEFGRGSAEVVIDGIWQELSPSREVLFQWSSWDHMSFGDSVYLEDNPRDYAHMNSLVVDDDGNWVVSSRGMSQILKIERATGNVLWRLGGAANDFTFIDDPFGGICGQHTASILENGHLLVFDNGQLCYPEMPERGELTRVVEYQLDEAAMTAELVWSYSREGAYSISQGSAQRLANGNTLIGWGLGPNLLVTEVTPEKEVAFELQGRSAVGRVQSYRAGRFAD